MWPRATALTWLLRYPGFYPQHHRKEEVIGSVLNQLIIGNNQKRFNIKHNLGPSITKTCFVPPACPLAVLLIHTFL